jgi:DNA-binding transcriptional ArsR family regulator
MPGDGEINEALDSRVARALGHPARLRILLGLRAGGPMSPADLSRSRLGKGIRVDVYSYHSKALERLGFLEIVDRSASDQSSVRYMLTKQLTQSLVDAAALNAILEVVSSIPDALSQWIDGPYIEEITALVSASGRRIT